MEEYVKEIIDINSNIFSQDELEFAFSRINLISKICQVFSIKVVNEQIL